MRVSVNGSLFRKRLDTIEDSLCGTFVKDFFVELLIHPARRQLLGHLGVRAHDAGGVADRIGFDLNLRWKRKETFVMQSLQARSNVDSGGRLHKAR